ncbi:MAG: hypothetical protein CSB16_01815 [Clostridiales bacterium]|nr:MAG: hypothetical protein CSB16_01815 [Clostridiales bacterium]
MRIFADYHTHTTYSDGKGSIEDNVKAAIDAGLNEIGISDHGFSHMFYGIKRSDRNEIKSEIKRLRNKYPNITIYDSIEANILGPSGKIDLKESEISDFDKVLCGYHFGSAPKSLSDVYMHLVNNIYRLTGLLKKTAVKLNTKALVNAVRKNNIDILVHPGDKGPVNIVPIAKECEKKKVIMEINERHTYLTEEQLIEIKDMNLNFVISSDAHIPSRVGKVPSCMYRVEKSGLNKNKIINLRR